MKIKITIIASTITALLYGQTVSAAPSQEKMWEMLQNLQKQNKALQAEVKQLKGQQIAVDEKLEATATVVESVGSNGGSTGWWNRTKFNGYGELHYNNLHDQDKNKNKNGDDFEEIDLHRVILEVSHEFNEDIRFFAEIEYEHQNQIQMEQAWLDFDINDNNTIKAGMVLVPVGIINETHEPPAFYGVERNLVESQIVPSTWFEGGVGLYGQLAQGLSYDAYIHSGLEVDGGFDVRSGRQKASRAQARDWATTGRLKYTGIAGLEASVTAQYQEDISQGEFDASATLLESHLIYNTGPFTLKALYAQWDIDGSAAKAANADEQYGWYIEPSWKLSHAWGIFARYSEVDENAGDNNDDTVLQQIDFGVNYYPHENIVVKADYQVQQAGSGLSPDLSGFNLGIGYQF
jgi:predicted porin